MRFLLPLLLLVVFAAAACSSAQKISSVPATSTSAPVDGEQIFAAYCSTCHGPAGEGLPKLGKPLTNNAFVAGLSDEELLTFLQEGRRVDDPLNTTGIAMPARGGNPLVTDEQLQIIVAYLRSLHTKS